LGAEGEGQEGGDALEALLHRLPSGVSPRFGGRSGSGVLLPQLQGQQEEARDGLLQGPAPGPPTALPYYSRLAATLTKYLTDIGPSLVQALEEEFQFLKGKKDQMNVEGRLKNIRFLGELTKFRVAPLGLRSRASRRARRTLVIITSMSSARSSRPAGASCSACQRLR